MRHVTSILPYIGIPLILLFTMRLGPAVAHLPRCTIGYDCGSEIQNLTTISLVDIDDCDLEVEQVNTTSEDVVLLQLNKYNHLEIIQCKVEISRVVNYCGMFSHNSIINYAEYIHSVTRDACRTAHDYGTLSINNIVVDKLQVNVTTPRSITMAGSIGSNGACEPAPFSDPYGSWSKVIATGNVKVTLKTALVKADIHSDIIYLPSGFRCQLSKEQCVDSDGGHTFWKSVPQRCSSDTYSKLYEGTATKFVSKQETVYSVNVDETSFSLKIIGSRNSCGATLYTTESPKLFLMKRDDLNNNDLKLVNKDTANLEIFQYANTKFVYVERHIRSQVKSLYLDVMKHHCRLEKEMLKNTLAIASTQPDEFAFRYMGGPGYMAVLAGEVVHIVQCVPVEVKFDHRQKCYNRLPVLRGNDTVFLTPRTRIISNYATEIPCNPLLLEYYKLQGTWYKFMPNPVSAKTPMSLKPSTNITWKYDDLRGLATSGIYTQSDLDSMNNRIMFPVDQGVVAESIAQQLTNNAGGAISFSNIFDSNLKQEIAEDIWSRTWGKFIKFGTTCAGFIGIFVCFSLIKTVADSVINGYALYKVFGLSFNLIGACWDTVANILLSKEKEKREQFKDNQSTSTLNFDKKRDFERETIDLETGVQNNTHQVPTPAPRRFRE